MGAVAKRFLGRCAATTERHSRFNWKFVSVAVDQLHFALHDVRTVLDCLDCYHADNLPDVERAENVVEAAVSAACLSNRRLAQAPLQRQYWGDMRIRFFVPIFFLVASIFAQSQSPSVAKHPFTFGDMMKLKRVDEPVPSPDGKWVAFSATDVDLEANTKISHLWIVPASGGESRRLSETTNHEERPRFSPDGKKLMWTSKATDPTQIWMCDFNSESGTLVGKPHQVTDISTGADGAIWSPAGKSVVFVSGVYPDC